MKSILKLSLALILSLGLQQAMAHSKPASSGKSKAVQQDTSVHYTYKILNSPHNTFGYDVLVNGKLAGGIHQPNIPGMPGNDGFKTKVGAESVAKLVIKKIKKGEMPPTVTPDEMKKLKAI